MRTAKYLLRSFLIVVSALLLTMSVTPPVSAHPGSTNADGGHMNRSTGEYHYHHGYSQHNHEDKNGDGVLDCPYEFDDQTDHSYHGDSGSADYDYDWDVDFDYDLDYSSDTPAIVDEPEPTLPPKQNENDGDSNSVLSFGKVLKALLWGILPAFTFGLFLSYFLSFLLMFFDGFENIAVLMFWILTLISYIVLVYLYLSK